MKRVLAALALAASSLAHAEEASSPLSALALTGRVFTDVYAPAKDLDTSSYRQASASVWLQGDPQLGEHGSARFILTGDAIENDTPSALGGSSRQFRLGLREGYFGYAKNGWEFRFGKQILPWGKSDAINPTDLLGAKDYTFFNPDEEVRRLGPLALWLNWTPAQGNSPFNFTLIAIPVFAQSRLLVPSTAVPSGFTLSGTPQAPAQTLGNTETAFKAGYAASSWDVSAFVFRGFNHIPEFAITGTTVSPTTGLPTAFTVGQVFHRYRAAGGDTSFTSGNWIFRGETAYVWTENDDGANPLVQPSHWDSVAGVERPIGDDFRVQAQFVYRYFPSYGAPSTASASDPITAAARQGIARANALLLTYQDKSRPGATFRFSYSNESSGIDAELFVLGNFVGGDYLIRPKASYAWTQALRTTLGIDWYGGPADRPLGSMKAFNSVFAEGKYSF